VGTHRFIIEGKEYKVEVGTRLGSSVLVTVNGTPYSVELSGSSAPPAPVAPAVEAASVPRVAPVVEPVSAPQAAPAPAATPRPSPAEGSGRVLAPIPGVVLDILVGIGDPVTVRSKLLVLEAMKMENEIFAGIAGVVTAVAVKSQQEVRQGDLLVTIEPS
jgi:biotin carboxyl carrier protein